MKGDYYYRGATMTVAEHSYCRSEVLRIEGYYSKPYDIRGGASSVEERLLLQRGDYYNRK